MTLATPGTPANLGTIVHCACTDMSIRDTVFELRPMFMTRAAEATGCNRRGGFETLGKACACTRRSWIICRAWIRSVPGMKNNSIEDTPVIDSDSIDLSQGTPFNRSASIGTVMSDSTSVADRPSASVFTCSDKGENSGTASSGTLCSCHPPTISNKAARAATIVRSRRPDEMIHRIMRTIPQNTRVQ